MTTEHTPTPWVVHEIWNGRGSSYAIGRDEVGADHTLARVNQPNGRPTGTNGANAAFIVRAVNSHDALMDAIQIILANTEQGAIRHMGHDGMDAYDALAKSVADTCRAAIARSTGEAK